MLTTYEPKQSFVTTNTAAALTELGRVYAEIERAEQEREIRDVREQAAVKAMRHPIDVERAYAIMGLLLGLLPPAAIFWKLFGYGAYSASSMLSGSWFYTALFLAMNLACAGVGYLSGDFFRRNLTRQKRGGPTIIHSYDAVEYISWPKFLFTLPLLAVSWGVFTGGAGGVLCFGLGFMIGPIFAVPIGIIGLTPFGILHRLLQRGGMIELSRLLIIAVGIVWVITEVILLAPVERWR